MQSTLFLNVVVRQCPTVFQLFSSENQSLLIGRDSLLVLDLRLHIVNRVRWLHLQRDRLASQCFHKNLHFEDQPQSI